MSYFTILFAVTALFFGWLFYIWNDKDLLNQRIKMLLFAGLVMNAIAAFQFIRETPNMAAVGVIATITAFGFLRLFVFWNNEDATNRVFRFLFIFLTLAHTFSACRIFDLI